MSNKNTLFVNKILERYKKVHNLKSNKEIAARMGLSESAFSNQKNRGSLDIGLLIESCDPDVNFNWLINGKGEPKIVDESDDLDQKFSDYEASLSDLNNTDISEADFLEFLLKQQEAVVSFLRKMKSDRSD